MRRTPRSRQAKAERAVVAIGFEIRVRLVLGEGERIWAQLLRAEAAQLNLAPAGRARV